MTDPVPVLVVDDSPFVCRLIRSFLESTLQIQVVAFAHDGMEAIEKVKALKPAVVTLDLEMPGFDGCETVDRIMHECPTPIVIISGVSRRSASMTLQAVDSGAVDFVLKDAPLHSPDRIREEIVAKVMLASRIRVIRSLRVGRFDTGTIPRRESTLTARTPLPLSESPTQRIDVPPGPAAVVVIGASTGGPPALKKLLLAIPHDFATPVIIVQHMPEVFTGILAENLDRVARLTVREAKEGDQLVPGTVLVVPGGYHLRIRADGRVALEAVTDAGTAHVPSIDITMQSVAEIYGSRARGVLLTGMGVDGAVGLKMIREQGGETFAQDEGTSVVYGMPHRANEIGAADHIGSPEEIARALGQPAGKSGL